MPTFSVRIPDDLADGFDRAAAVSGGRSALLRQLIQSASVRGPARSPPPLGRRDAMRLMVRLGALEAAHVDAAARSMGLRPAGWLAALVRAHLLGRPAFPRGQELAIRDIRIELRRIGVNVNQIARAMNTAVLEGRVLELELAALEDLRLELRGHMGGLREAFEGNLAGWAADL